MSTEMRFGPETPVVERMVECLRRATPEEVDALAADRGAALDAVTAAVRRVARSDARDASWRACSEVRWASKAAWYAGKAAAWDVDSDAWVHGWDAIMAVLARHGISPEQFGELTAPWIAAFGPLPEGSPEEEER